MRGLKDEKEEDQKGRGIGLREFSRVNIEEAKRRTSARSKGRRVFLQGLRSRT